MRTYVYIDALNLYYGALRKTPFKWLNIVALSQNMLADYNQVTKVKYFTAKVRGTRHDIQAPFRQQVYLRALKAYQPEVDIHLGHFLAHDVLMPLAKPTIKKKFALVTKSEEKGSDVNLAVSLVNDAWLDVYDCAVVITNDSDLAIAMRLVKKHHPNKVIGLFTPTRLKTSKELMRYADFQQTIETHDLKQSQLPEFIPSSNLKKPASW